MIWADFFIYGQSECLQNGWNWKRRKWNPICATMWQVDFIHDIHCSAMQRRLCNLTDMLRCQVVVFRTTQQIVRTMKHTSKSGVNYSLPRGPDMHDFIHAHCLFFQFLVRITILNLFYTVYQIILGTIEATDAADTEWVYKPYMNTTKKRRFLAVD